MHVAIVGTGYVGLVAGAGFSDLGLRVTCVDIDEDKIRLLGEGKVPIFEPGLEEIIRRNVKRGRLDFSTDVAAAVRNALAIFVAVGTNAGQDGMPDLTQLWSAADLIARSMDNYKVLAIKSTVPVGTAAAFETRVSERLTQALKFDVVSNPEFLREGSAVDDFFHPNRIVIGSASERAAAIMKDIYRPLYLIQTPFVFTTREEAELIKYASNAFLGLKVSFINELANLCGAIGPSADVHVVAHALGLDHRIGPKFLHPGPGFGGHCLPKDTRALAQMARSYGQEFRTVAAAVEVNDRQFLRVVEDLKKACGPLAGKVIAVMGLSFKPNTDDVRQSRALKICEALRAERSALRVFDPAAMEQARRALGENGIHFCADAYEAARGSDALAICTEWNEFRNLDLEKIKKSMRGDVLLDARNIMDPAKAKSAGFRYYAMGRG